MKKIVIALVLSLIVLPASAQVVINVRRPGVLLMVEGGPSLSTVSGYDGAQGMWNPYIGVGMDLPMTQHLNMLLRLTYLNKSYTASTSHDIHAVEMGILQFNWYPFSKYLYLGAGFTFGGNILINRMEADGSKTRVKADNKDALGLTLGYDLEAGVNLSFWPIGDRLSFFARYSQDILGSPFGDGYRGSYGIPKGMRCGNLTAGVRIPIFMFRD